MLLQSETVRASEQTILVKRPAISHESPQLMLLCLRFPATHGEAAGLSQGTVFREDYHRLLRMDEINAVTHPAFP